MNIYTDGQNEDDDDEEYIDIDTELVFQEISKKRDFLTFTDVLNWDVFQQVYIYMNGCLCLYSCLYISRHFK
jgi:hypothetical protein